MTSVAHVVCEISDSSHVGEARRCAAGVAHSAGLDSTQCGNVAIVVTELATNILNHAARGTILLHELVAPGAGVEVIAIDRGPGMPNIDHCMADGYSTGGTKGNGLGAVRRLADQFDVWSDARGTAAVARIVQSRGGATSAAIGFVCVPKDGEQQCGDAWAVRFDQQTDSILVVDGLGHGPDAETVALAAVAAFRRSALDDAKAMLEQVDAALRASRGAAVAVAMVPKNGQSLRYCAVGNIGGRLESASGSRGLVSGNGIVGGSFRTPQTFEYDFVGETLLILFSDGLQSRWDLDAYAGLRFRHPALIAAILFRDFSRGRDDVTVLVVRLGTGTSRK